MSTPEWYVGQKVILQHSATRGKQAESDPGVVTKIARRYMTVERGGRFPRSIEFDMATGIERGYHDNTHWGMRVTTPEIKAAKARRHRAREACSLDANRYSGITIPGDLTTEQYEAIAKIINPEFVAVEGGEGDE